MAAVLIILALTALQSQPRITHPPLILAQKIRMGMRAWDCAFTASGKLMAVAGEDGLVEYSCYNWKQVAAVHKSCDKVLSVGGAGEVIFDQEGSVWSFLGGKAKMLCPLPSGNLYVYGLASASTNTLAICASKIYFVDLTSTKIVASFEHPEYGGPIVSAWQGVVGGFGWARYFSGDGTSSPADLPITKNEAFSFCYACGPRRLYVGGASGRIYACNSLHSRQSVLASRRRQLAYCMATNPSGSLLALGFRSNLQNRYPHEKNLLLILDGNSGKVLQRVRATSGVESLAFNPSGDLLAEVDRSGALNIFKVKTNQRRWYKHD